MGFHRQHISLATIYLPYLYCDFHFALKLQNFIWLLKVCIIGSWSNSATYYQVSAKVNQLISLKITLYRICFFLILYLYYTLNFTFNLGCVLLSIFCIYYIMYIESCWQIVIYQVKKIHSNFFELFNVLSMLWDCVLFSCFRFSSRSDPVHIIPNFLSNF
jgi:hypothetical protein